MRAGEVTNKATFNVPRKGTYTESTFTLRRSRPDLVSWCQPVVLLSH